MVPWWGWLIISVISLYVLVAAVVLTVAGGAFWTFWRRDKSKHRRTPPAGRQRHPNRWSL